MSAGDRAAADNRHEGVEAFASKGRDHIIGAIRLLDETEFVDAAHAEGVDARAGSEQTRAGAVNAIGMEPHPAAIAIAIGSQQPVEPIVDADQIPPEPIRRARRPERDGVESRAHSRRRN